MDRIAVFSFLNTSSVVNILTFPVFVQDCLSLVEIRSNTVFPTTELAASSPFTTIP